MGSGHAHAHGSRMAWLLLVGFCLLLTALGWALGGYRVASLFLFCALLSVGGLIFYADRVALGQSAGRTNTPRPRTPITSPDSRRTANASVTVRAEMPNSSASSRAVGSLEPGV